MRFNGYAPRARSREERELEQSQRDVTKGQLAEFRRRELIVQLHRAGMTQLEIAARLSRAAVGAGGDPVSIYAVEHVYRRYKYRRK